MLRKIHLQNFKRFEQYTIHARRGNVLVGPNNSGKSSILDALRLLDVCLRYAKRKRPDTIVHKTGWYPGYHIPESILPFDIANVTTDYSDDDAVIEFYHENGNKAVLILHPNREVKFFVEASGRAAIKTSGQFNTAFPLDLIVIPTLSPLEAEEVYVTDETVQRNRTRRQAARSFRNIWLRESEEAFQVFRKQVESAWHGVEISKPELFRSDKAIVQMFFTENRITREIQWAGFGFQVWLQIQTHLMRGSCESIIIIDEPDVYLHPNVQRALFRNISMRLSQCFMATHATEIINEASAEDILIVNADRRIAHRIKTDEDFASMLDYIGSSQNADFTIISKVKKALFFEGRDSKVIRRFAETLKCSVLADDQSIPVYKLGGFANSVKLKNAAWAFENILNVKLGLYCLLDRDYRCDEEIEEYRTEALDSGVALWVLRRKEIENYLLSPAAIARLAVKRIRSRGSDLKLPDEEWVVAVVEEFAEMKRRTISAQITAKFSEYFRLKNRHEDSAVHIAAGQDWFEEQWSTFNGRLELLPGKDALGFLNARMQEQFKVSVTPLAICNEIRASEVPGDFRELLEALNESLSA